MYPEAEFISECIAPAPASADTRAMARGLAGLPSGFQWRDHHYEILEVLEDWKHSEPENHRPGGERYYRKHYYRVRVDSGEVMTLYVVRKVKPGENPKRRWWLYSIDRAGAAPDA